MKSPFFLQTVLVVALGVSPVLCQAQVSQPKRAAQKIAAQPAGGQPGSMQQSTSALSPQEQQFAMKLSALHRQIFIMVFTPDLRKEAMGMMAAPGSDMDDDETPMTADMAVEETISNHRDAMPAQMSSTTSNQKVAPQQQPAKQQTQNTTKKKSYWD